VRRWSYAGRPTAGEHGEWACILRHNVILLQSAEVHGARQTGGNTIRATWCAGGETGHFIPTSVILGINLGNPKSSPFDPSCPPRYRYQHHHHHSPWVNHVRITALSQPRFTRIGMLQLTVMSPLRVSSVAVYGRHGEAVKLCVDAISHSSPLLSTNAVSSCLMCAVNANELERLKKRFMKLDRCHSTPLQSLTSPSAALYPKYSHATITCPLRI